LRVRGFAGTCITFSYPREKTRRIENQTRTRTRGYKLTPKPAPYRVFTRGHAGKMCPLPSLLISYVIIYLITCELLAIAYEYVHISSYKYKGIQPINNLQTHFNRTYLLYLLFLP
jgi:hypothetical protein